ncbi:MAG: beta strand repeat-containing protein [Sphaerospermopsis kisseleviana]
MNPIVLLAFMTCSLLLALSGRAQAQTNIYWDTSTNAGTGGSGTWSSSTVTWATNPSGAAVTNGGPTGNALFAITNTNAGVNAWASGNYLMNFGGTAGRITNSGSFQMWGINILTNGYVFVIDGTGANTRTLTMTNSLDLGTNSLTFDNGPRGTNAYVFAGPANSGWTGGITASNGSAGIVIANTNSSNLTNFGFYINSGGTVSSNAPINILTLSNTRVMLGSQNSGGANFNSAITNNSAGGSPLELTNSSTGTLSFNGVISGSNGLIVNNSSSGRISLNAANTYGGGTTLNNTGTGTIQISNAAAFGTGTITSAGSGVTNVVRAELSGLDVTNNWVIGSGSILRLNANNSGWNITASGVISGAGSMFFSNSGVNYRLAGTNNSFGGGVTVGNGTLWFNTMGMAGANSSLGTNGVLQTGGGTTTAGFRWTNIASEISDKSISLNSTTGGLTFLLDSATAGVSLTINGGITSTASGNKTITLNANNTNTLTINGVINQFAGSTNNVVVNSGSVGTLVLGNTGNSFGGGVSISGGASSTNTVQVAQIGNAGANSALGTNGTINIGGSSSSGVNALKYTGNGETSDKVINLAGTLGGATLDQSGTGNLKFTTAMTSTGAGAKTLALQGSTAGTGEIASNIGDLGGNVISLSKSGTGTWSLSGNNSYSGNTTISGGTLAIIGTNTGTGAVIMNSSSSSVLRLGQTNALANGVLAGASSSGNTGTANLTVGGNHSIASYGSTANAGQNMNFTNSSGSAATLTFTAATNYITVSSGTSGGRTVANNSTNLTIVFNGAVDIGSSDIGDVQFNGAGHFTINGPIFNTNTGVRSLTKNGSGTVTLVGNNTYNGATTVSGGGVLVLSGSNSFNGLNISSGTVSIANSNALGLGIISNTSSTGLIKIDGSVGTGNDWTLANNVSSGVTTNDSMAFAPGTGNAVHLSGAVSGAGWLKVSSGGDLYLDNTNNSYTGGTEVGTGRILIADPLALGTGGINFGTTTNSHLVATTGMLITNNMTIGSSGSSGYTANIDSGANAVTISSIIADKAGNAFGGKLVKLGSGSLSLSEANTYTGSTTVSAGTLELAKVGGSALGFTASVSVATNAVLLLSQSDQVNNSAAVSLSGGTIQRASGVSEVFGNLSVTGNGTLDYGTGGTGTLSFGTYTPSALLSVQNFGQGNVLTFAQDLSSYLPGLQGGGFSSSLFSIDNGFVSDWNVTTANTFTITAIPEPSTYLAAAGLLALMIWPSRRRLLKDAKSILGLRASARDRLAR